MNTGIQALIPLLNRFYTDPLVQETVDLLGGAPSPDLSQTTAWWSFPQVGLDIMLRVDVPSQRARVSAVHLFSEGYEGHCEYRGGLINGLRFGDERQSVCDKLGTPSETGGGQFGRALNRVVSPWDKFRSADCTIQCQYNEANRLELVSLLLS